MTFLPFVEMSEVQNLYSNTTDAGQLTQDFSTELDTWNYNIDPSLRGIMSHPSDQWNDQEILFCSNLAETPYYTCNPMPIYSGGLQMEHFDPFAAQTAVPFAYEVPRTSPAPSQGVSVWSDGVSSLSDEDSAPDVLINSCAYGSNHIRQPLSGIWTDDLPVPPEAQVFEHIHPKDVQESMDPQEFYFEHDDGSILADTKEEESASIPGITTSDECLVYPFRVVHREVDEEAEQLSTNEDRADAVTRVPDEVVNTGDDDDDDDDDNDDEEEEDDEGETEGEHQTRDGEVEDDDYHPRSTRTKPRRSSRITTLSPNSKRAKIIKATARPKLMFRCNVQDCSHAAKDAQSLVRHTATAHTRPFVCAFRFAGCTGTFGSKNEWKRHVSSQHLALHYWRCELGQCGQPKRTLSKAPNGCAEPRGSDFNRKDLFTQHLRRMHAPVAVRRQNRENSSEWETQVKELQTGCLKVRRQPPRKAMCPVEGCDEIFEGPTCWDARMEHVGRHLEREGPQTAGGAIDQGKDVFLVEYALKERIVERAANGSYVLCRNGGHGVYDEAEGGFE